MRAAFACGGQGPSVGRDAQQFQRVRPPPQQNQAGEPRAPSPELAPQGPALGAEQRKCGGAGCATSSPKERHPGCCCGSPGLQTKAAVMGSGEQGVGLVGGGVGSTSVLTSKESPGLQTQPGNLGPRMVEVWPEVRGLSPLTPGRKELPQ